MLDEEIIPEEIIPEEIISSECPLCGGVNTPSIEDGVELLSVHCDHCDADYYCKKNGTGYSVMKK